MFKTELYKQPRVVKHKKLHRGSFKLVNFSYNDNFILNKKNVISFISRGSGFYYWKMVIDFQKRVGRLFKKRQYMKFRFNFSLNWSFSYKTHKSRMGKGKGVVNIDDWCSRIQSGKALMFLKSRSILVASVRTYLYRNALILPVSVLPVYVL